jgi:hypothetical protein
MRVSRNKIFLYGAACFEIGENKGGNDVFDLNNSVMMGKMQLPIVAALK